jgi:hypothetical protein
VGVTININGLTLCHVGSGGLSRATLPDVCKTPAPGGPVPIPYPNIAFSKDLVKGTTTVFADGGNSCAVEGSEFSKSTGDEPGTAGGVTSGTYTKEATWITFSFDVKFEGKAACRLTDKMFHNHANTVNMSGLYQLDLPMDDILKYVLCQIHCEVLDDVEKNPLKKGEKYSHRAQRLGNGKYAGALDNAARKALGEGAEFALEKSVKVAVEKGAMAAGRRVPLAAATLERRIRNQLLKSAGVQVAKRVASKAILKFIPIVNVAALAWDVYEIGTAAYEISVAVADFMSKYDIFRIRPDAMFTSADGATKIFDHKFPGDSFSNNPGQEELYKKATGERPAEVSKKECNNCKKV